MKCIEAQQMVKPYIEGQLSDRQLEQFLEHVGHCRECYEELEIYFSIYETLGVSGDKEEEDEYDFKGKLERDMKNSRRYLYLRKAYRFFRFAVLLLAELLLVITIVTAIEMKGEDGSKGTTVYRVIYGRQGNIKIEPVEETDGETPDTAATAPKDRSRKTQDMAEEQQNTETGDGA